MSKHTPGPWTLEIDEACLHPWSIVDNSPSAIPVCLVNPNLESESSANAHLLAAAPALLEAAKAALDLLNGLDECEMLLKFGDALYIVEQLDAAIAAADPDFVC